MSPARTLGPMLRFLLVGSTTVLLDGAAYAVLAWAGLPVDVAKGAGFLIGAVFAYVANWRFTFGARRSRWSEVLFVLVYLLALALNVTVNALVRGVLEPGPAGATIAFLVATSLSAAWNFVGMSLFVFRHKEPSVEHAAGR